MRVLITGSNGFIGTHLCHRLSNEDGIQTLGLDIKSRGHSDCNNFKIRDIRDRASLALDFDFFRPHVVMHLAARLGVENVMENPGATITDNVIGTMNVIELAQSYDAHVFFASTSDVYGHSKDLPFSEDGYSVVGPAHEPRWSYAISKLAGEHLTQAAHGTILRFFNTTGPGQTAHYVLPYFVREAVRGNDLVVYGDGNQTRCFTDVRDVCRALVRFIDQDIDDVAGETYNIGSSHEVTMLGLAHLVRELVNPKVDIVLAQPPHNYTEMPKRKPDINKIYNLFGWKPSTPLEITIRDIKYYMEGLL